MISWLGGKLYSAAALAVVFAGETSESTEARGSPSGMALWDWNWLLWDVTRVLIFLFLGLAVFAVAYLIIGAPLLFYPFLYLRLDLLSVVLAVGGLALVRRRRPALGGAVLALACFAKVWPVLLAPALLIRRSWRAVASFCAVGAIGVAAWVGWVGTAGINQVLSMRHSTVKVPDSPPLTRTHQSPALADVNGLDGNAGRLGSALAPSGKRESARARAK